MDLPLSCPFAIPYFMNISYSAVITRSLSGIFLAKYICNPFIIIELSKSFKMMYNMSILTTLCGCYGHFKFS